MHAAGRILDHDLRLFVGGSENKIRMVYAIFSSISHSNHERLKWRRVQQFTNPRFHRSILPQGFGDVHAPAAFPLVKAPRLWNFARLFP
jgi:hypothetical protein